MIYPTTADRKYLAARFQLPFESTMQDWEIEIANPEKLPEFISTFLQDELSEGQQVSLAEIIFQSLEELLMNGKEDMAKEYLNKVLPALKRHDKTLKGKVDYWKTNDFCLSIWLMQAAD
jgi:hypothetical protein